MFLFSQEAENKLVVWALTFQRYLFSFEFISIYVYASDAFIKFDFPLVFFFSFFLDTKW